MTATANIAGMRFLMRASIRPAPYDIV